MLECPNCKKKTIRNFEKLMLGPSGTIRCKNCDAKISISWWSFVVFGFVLVSLWFTKDKLERAVFIPSMLVAWCIYFYIHMKYIPLVIRVRNDEDS